MSHDNGRRTAVAVSFALAVIAGLACSDTRPDEATAELSTAQLAPDLRIDGHAEELVPVSWIGVSPSGVVAITQVQDAAVRFYDPAGAFIGSVGRKGAGPGEFQRPLRGGWLGDTLWISDTELNRVTLIAPDLTTIRTLPPLGGAKPTPGDAARLPSFPFVFPYGVYGDGTVLATAIGAAGDPLAEAIRGQALVRVTQDGYVDRLVLETPEDLGSVQVTFDGGMAGASVPFFPRPHWAASDDGSRIATVATTVDNVEGGTFELAVHDARTGAELLRRRYPFRGVPIPGAIVDSAMNAATERARRPELKRALETEGRSRVPPAYPPVSALFVGKDQRIWIGLRTTDAGRHWLVLATDGTPVARYLVPSTVTLRIADATHAWGLERDDLDVESVVRYRLPHSR